MVPDVRIAGLATRRTAWPRSGQPSRTGPSARCAACVAMAPSSRPPGVEPGSRPGRSAGAARPGDRASRARAGSSGRGPSRPRRAAPHRRAGRGRRARRSGTRARRAGTGAVARSPRAGRRGQHGLDDLGVAGTAAEVSRASASRTSSAVGAGFSLRSAFAASRMPGVQNPHWAAPASANATCSGSSRPSASSPSTVSERAPAHVRRQHEAGANRRPSASTVHVPQTPSPHPYLVPSRSSPSRKRSRTVQWSGASWRTVVR